MPAFHSRKFKTARHSFVGFLVVAVLYFQRKIVYIQTVALTNDQAAFDYIT